MPYARCPVRVVWCIWSRMVCRYTGAGESRQQAAFKLSVESSEIIFVDMGRSIWWF
jgi:hypothetical protein